MSGAQAKIFMSCGRLLAWPFGVEMWEDWEMAPGRCKVHGFLLSDFFFPLLYFTSDYLYFLNSHRWFVGKKNSKNQSD